jgi:hypothetical protein
MTSHNTTPCLPQSKIETAEHLFDNWLDPVEAGLQPLLPNIEVLISGGAPLLADEKLETLRKVTPRFCEMYGAAAIGPMAALRANDIGSARG